MSDSTNTPNTTTTIDEHVLGEAHTVLVRTQKMQWRVDVYRRNKWIGTADRDGVVTAEYRQMTYGQALSVFEHLMELKQLALEAEQLSQWSSIRITCIVAQKLPTE